MARHSMRRRIHDRPSGRPGVDRHGGTAAGRPEHVDVAGRERRRGPGPPGGPPAGGPDGRVEALLAERALHDGERHRRRAVVVGRRHLAGRPAEQPGLDLRGQQERDLPGARRSARCVEAAGLELVGEPGGQLGEAAGLERGRGHDVMWAHGILFGGSVRLAGPVPRRSPQRAGSRMAPGPGTRAGRLRPPVGDEVTVQGVTRVRHDGRERSCSRTGMSSAVGVAALYRIATILCHYGCRTRRVD